MRVVSRDAVLAGIVALVPLAAARATVFIDNQFGSETVNTVSGTPNADYNAGLAPVNLGAYNLAGGMTLPTYAKNDTTAGGRGAAVFAANSPVSGFSSQAVGLFSHPSQYFGGNEGKILVEHTPGVNDALAGTTTGKYVFSFDMSVASTTLNTSAWTVKPEMALKANYFGTADQWWTHGGNDTIFSVWENQGNFMLTSADGAGASTNTIIFSGFTASTPYHIAATLDMDAHTFTVAINGTQVPGTFNQLVPASWDKGIGEYAANGGQPNDGTEGFFHFYDNIRLETAVPEPVSLSALGLGAMLLLRRRQVAARA